MYCQSYAILQVDLKWINCINKYMDNFGYRINKKKVKVVEVKNENKTN